MVLGTTLNCPTILSVHQTNPMRYNPSTDRAISIEEIAAQCRAAILKADQERQERLEHERLMDAIADRLYDDILENARWEEDLLIAA